MVRPQVELLGRPTSSRRPRCRTAMRSASSKASSWSWVTKTTVRPSSRCTRRRVCRSSMRILASSAPKGSSRSRKRRLVGQGAGDRHPLLLAARKLPGPPAAEAGEADQGEQFLAPLAPLGGLLAAHRQRELDVVGHRHVAEQRVMLEHEADAPLARPQGGNVPAAEQDGAGVDRHQAGDRPQQGALAAAGGAEQNEKLALLDRQRNVVDHRGAGVELATGGGSRSTSREIVSQPG